MKKLSKKIFIFALLALGSVALVACQPEADPVPDRDATWHQAMGNTTSLNFLMATDASSGDVRDLISGNLFRGGFDWHSAIERGIASEVGDFSQIARAGAVDGYSIEELGFTMHLFDAATFPYNVTESSDYVVDGVLDQTASRESLGDHWRVTLRDDLTWSNGDRITSQDFAFTVEMLITPALNNGRANFIHDSNYLNLVNSREFFDGYIEDFSEVGFDIIDDLTFEVRLNARVSQWRLMGNLNLIPLVHQARFLSGMNADGTATSYGSIDLIPFSSGPWVLDSWTIDTQFMFSRRDDHHDAENMNFAAIRGFINSDQTVIVNEFKAGNLDQAGVGGAIFWPQFKDDPNVILNPNSQFMWFEFSLGVPADSDRVRSPLLTDPEFRQAMYLAINRLEFATDIVGPSVPNLGHASSIAKMGQLSPEFWNQSDQFRNTLVDRDLSPDTYGFDPIRARSMFDEIVARLEEAGTIAPGAVIPFTFTYFNAEGNQRIADWLEPSLEGVFGERFDFIQEPLALELFNARRAAGDFDFLWTGLSGAPNDTVFLMHFVYIAGNFLNSLGFPNFGLIEVSADLGLLIDIIWDALGDVAAADIVTELHALVPVEVAHLEGLISDLEDELAGGPPPGAPANWATVRQNAIAAHNVTITEMESLLEFTASETVLATLTELLAELDGFATGGRARGRVRFYQAMAEAGAPGIIDGDLELIVRVPRAGVFTGTADALWALYDGSVRFFTEWDARVEIENNIAAAFQGLLLDEMPVIPAMSSVGAVVFSDATVLMVPAWHTMMGWGGLRYRFKTSS